MKKELHQRSASRGERQRSLFGLRRTSAGGTRTHTRRLVLEALETRRLLNAAPTATDDAYFADENQPLFVEAPGVLANDSDPDTGDELTVSDVDLEGTLGVVVLNPNGSLAYDPCGEFDHLAAGQTATDTFVYTVSDGNGGTDTATVTITIVGNDDPIAVDDAYDVDEDATLDIPADIGLLANDSDPGDTLVVSGVDTSTTEGNVTWDPNGSFTYDPNGKFDSLAVSESATDTFSYTVTDGKGGSDNASVTITINGENDAPTAVDDAYETDEDTPLSVAGPGLLLNDSDPDTSDTLTVTGVNLAGTLGTVTWSSDGKFVYDPDGKLESLSVGETATDSFTYTISDGHGGEDTATVTITINGENDTPTAVDDAYDTDEDTPLNVASSGLLTNDSDPDDSDELAVSDVDTASTKGTVSWNGDGSFTYDPNGQFDDLQLGDSATDSFTYTISDGHGGTASAVVTITISGLPNDPPVARDDAYETYAGKFLFITAPGVLGNDSDLNPADVLSVKSVDQSGTEGLVAANADGSFAYDPFGQFDHLQPGESAIDTFIYTLSDGDGGTDTATVTITVVGNDPPTAVDDAYATDENTPLDVPAHSGLLANDTDPGDTLEVVDANTSDTLGVVTWNADGSFTYDPNGEFESVAAGETAEDTFTYTVSDGKGGADTGTVVITISGANNSPVAADDNYETGEKSVLNVPAPGLLANDTDPDGDPLEVVVGETTGAQGEVFAFENGSFIYDPREAFEYLAAGETAHDTFTYTVTDKNGGTDTSTVTITVNGLNDAPLAADDDYATDEDTPLNVPVDQGLLANDSDPDANDVLAVSGVDTAGTLGKVSWNSDGSFTYDPDGEFDLLQLGDSATDSFTYSVSDGQGGSDTALVTITISGLANNPPVADDDAYDTDKSAPLVIAAPGILANDTDPDPTDVLVVKSVDQSGTKGLVVANPDGSFAYEPPGEFDDLIAGESAEDTFTYTVSDGEGGTDTATVTITILGNNDPVARDDAYETGNDDVLQLLAPGLLANDLDPDDPLEVTAVDTEDTQGVVAWDADGGFSYDPDGQFDSLEVGESATDSFSYTVSDGKGNTDTATVIITVKGDALQVSQVVINDGSAQRSMVTSVSVAFNADVTIAENAFQLKNHHTEEIVSTSFATTLNEDGNTVATLSFLSGPSVQTRASGNSLVDGNYQLTIDAAQVTYNGVQLDGDGQGGNYVFGARAADKFFRLFGDAVGQDRLVNLLDFGAFRSAYGTKVDDDEYRGELDLDGNGVINLTDFAGFRARYGKKLDFE